MSPTSVFLLVASCGSFTFVSCRLITKPSERSGVIVVSSGDSVTLRCSTDLTTRPVAWSRKPVGSITYHWLFIDNELLPSVDHRFDIVRTTGVGSFHFDLVIKSTGSGDAGRYSCQDEDGEGSDVGSVELVLVREAGATVGCRLADAISASTSTSPRTTEQQIEGNSEILKCAIEFVGSITVSTSWTFQLVDSSGKSLADGVSKTVNYTGVNRQRTEGGGSIVETSFTVESVARRELCCYRCMVDNIGWSSSYSCNWPKQTAEEMVPVDNVTIEAVREVTPVGEQSVNVTISDKLVCRAAGDPSPSYEWIDLQTGRSVSSGPELSSIDIPRGDRFYRCRASNIIGNIIYVQWMDFQLPTSATFFEEEIYSAASMDVHDPYQKFHLPYIIPVGVCTLIIFFVGIAVCVRRKRNTGRVAEATTVDASNLGGVNVDEDATWWYADDRRSWNPHGEHVVVVDACQSRPEMTYSVAHGVVDSSHLYEPLKRGRANLAMV